MEEASRPVEPDVLEADCTKTRSIDDPGIVDEITLLQRTDHRRAAGRNPTCEPTAEWFDRIQGAFVWAGLETVDGTDAAEEGA